MIQLAPSATKSLLKVAKLYNSKFIHSEYEVYFSSGKEIQSIKLKFDKEQFLHLVGLKASKSSSKFGTLLRRSISQILFDLILIEHDLPQDFDYSRNAQNLNEKVKTLPTALSFVTNGGLISRPSKMAKEKYEVDVLIGTGRSMIGFLQDKGCYYPRTCMETNLNRWMNPHSKLSILAIKRIRKDKNLDLSFVDKNISETQADFLFNILNVDNTINLQNENHRLLISKAKGTEFLFELKEHQEHSRRASL